MSSSDYLEEWQDIAIQLGMEERTAKVFSDEKLIGFIKQELPIFVREHTTHSTKIAQLIKHLEKLGDEQEIYRIVTKTQFSMAQTGIDNLMKENNDNLEKILSDQREKKRLETENQRLNEELVNQEKEFKEEKEKWKTETKNKDKVIEKLNVAFLRLSEMHKERELKQVVQEGVQPGSYSDYIW